MSLIVLLERFDQTERMTVAFSFAILALTQDLDL
jgi:hypothetical protein